MATDCFCIRPCVKPAPSHVYPITTNDLTWAPKQACGHINNGILFCFAARIYCFYETVSLAFDILLAGQPFCVYSMNRRWPRKVSRTGEKPHCDPWRRFLHWEPKGFTRTSQQLHSHEKAGNATQVERGQNGPSAKQLENIMIAFVKLSLILTGTARLDKEALSGPHKEVVTPVEKHAPTNELISDMNCGVYVRVLRCSAHSFPSLLWAECSRGKLPTVLQHAAQSFLTETAL